MNCLNNDKEKLLKNLYLKALVFDTSMKVYVVITKDYDRKQKLF